MTNGERLTEAAWPRDKRSAAEIEDGIREELESHLELLVEELVRSGTPADEARRRASAQFGDVDRYAAECRKIDLADRLFVRRLLVAACLALVGACGYLGWRVWQSERAADDLRRDLAQALATAPNSRDSLLGAATGDEPAPLDDRAAWAKRLTGLRDHMHTAFSVGPELTLLEPDVGLEIVRAAWPEIRVQEVKTGLLKAFAFSKALAPKKHPRLVQVLHLGMSDPDLEVRQYAASYLKEIAHEDFNLHPAAYATWHRTYGEMPLDDVLQETQRTPPAGLLELLDQIEDEFRGGDLRKVADTARGIGELGHPYAIPTLIGILDADNSHETISGVGGALSELAGVNSSPFHDGPWWRRWWSDAKRGYADEIQRLTIRELPKTPHGAAYRPLPKDLDTLPGLLRHYAEGRVTEQGNVWSWAMQVAQFQDPTAIPFMIGAIEAKGGYETVYGIGWFGLGRLTGVDYDESHDGAWWRAWWNENKGQYPAEAQAIEIPDLRQHAGG
jgi:hypothetical protein